MADEWFFSQNGQRNGPFPFAELRRQAMAGLVQPIDLVWNESMPDWSPAKTIPGLFSGGARAKKPNPNKHAFSEIDTARVHERMSFFDLDFSNFIAVRIVSFLWLLWLVIAGFVFLGGVVAGAFYLPVIQWLVAIVGSLLVLSLYSVFVRVFLETLVVIFRISEDLGKIRQITEDRYV